MTEVTDPTVSSRLVDWATVLPGFLQPPAGCVQDGKARFTSPQGFADRTKIDPLESELSTCSAGCGSRVGPNDIHEFDSNHRQNCVRDSVECFHALDYPCTSRFEYRSR
jgi:hypothetical protein